MLVLLVLLGACYTGLRDHFGGIPPQIPPEFEVEALACAPGVLEPSGWKALSYFPALFSYFSPNPSRSSLPWLFLSLQSLQ